MLIANGPSPEALMKSPVYRAMESGSIVRVEEISRCASEVQDALISLLSEKRLSVPELGLEVPAQKGFSLIATANTRDKGVNDMSAALKRRFNIVVLPAPADIATEMDIVKTRVAQLSAGLDLNAAQPDGDTVEKVVTIFRELRSGVTLDGKQKLKSTSGVLSTAEAISLLANSMALAGSFGSGTITAEDLAAALQGAVVKDEEKDKLSWNEYLENVMKKRGSAWLPLYHALPGAGKLMAGPYIFGVRHLSPAAAWHLRPHARRGASAADSGRGTERFFRSDGLDVPPGYRSARRHAGLHPGKPCAYHPLSIRGVFPGIPGDPVGAPERRGMPLHGSAVIGISGL